MMLDAGLSSLRRQGFAAAAFGAPLTRKDERSLARKWHEEGDPRAMERLVRAHLGLVVRIAYEFRQSDIPIDDLIQEGNVGLTIAARRFDYKRTTRLATYAAYWIRACMTAHMIRCHGPVRIGTTRAQRKIFFGLGRARRRIERGGKPAGAQDLAKELGVDLGELEVMRVRLALCDVSINDDQRRGGGYLGERLIMDEPTPEEVCTTHEEQIQRSTSFDRALRRLDPREREIITMRHLRDQPETLAALGRRYGLSRERVRQIEKRAKERMREICGGAQPRRRRRTKNDAC